MAIKDHKEYKLNADLDFTNLTEEEAVNEIRSAFKEANSSGCVDPKLSLEYDGYFYGDSEKTWIVRGHVPMTEKEIEKAENKRKIAAANANRKKEEKEASDKRELVRLAKKFNVEIPDL